MPITPFLAGQVFEPETLGNMGTAFEMACAKLGLVSRTNPATALIAKAILNLAQQGVRDVDTLLKMTLKEFDLGERGRRSWRQKVSLYRNPRS